MRRVSDLDREALERDDFKFNVHLLLGGQVRGEPPGLVPDLPPGQPAAGDRGLARILQIGECKYGRPILDRGVRYDCTTLEEAAKYALISLDSTMRSNVTVGPPIDLLVYGADELEITRYRRFPAKDPDLLEIRMHWEQALRKAVGPAAPDRFRARRPLEPSQMPPAETIELVEPGANEPSMNAELQPQAKPPSS